jgi:hypothetical protein
LLRQGESANDVAVLLPNDDVYAGFSPGKASLSDGVKQYVTSTLMHSILNAGYNLDYIDVEAIKEKGIRYPVLVLPHVARLSPEILKTIAAYAEQGGHIIAIGTTPGKAPGFLLESEVTVEVQRLAGSLFNDHAHVQIIAKDDETGAAIRKILKPDLELSAADGNIGFIHRRLGDSDIYFIANTGNHPVVTSATFRAARPVALVWDPFTGGEEELPPGAINLNLEPYESRVIVFRNGVPHKSVPPANAHMLADISTGWTLRFEGSAEAKPFDTRTSWTADATTRFFSGKAVYNRTIQVNAADLANNRHVSLDFGEGTPVDADPKIKSGMRALLEGPVREAAVVVVNGQRVGSVWHPPYRLDITTALRAGSNEVEIRVANTAINTLAGRSRTDYRLLWARYGQRFIPQDMDHLEPLPSGLLDGVRLIGNR